MAPKDRERKLTLLAQVDERAALKGEARIASLREEFESLQRAEGDAAQASRRAGSALGEVNQGSQTNIRFLQARIDAMQEFTRGLQEEIRLLRQEDAALRQRAAGLSGLPTRPGGVSFQAADEFNSLVRRQAGLLGDVDTALQTVGGAVSGFAPGVGGGIRATGDIFAVAEALPQLQGALSGLPATIQATAAALTSSGGLTTALAGTIGPVATVAGAALIAAPALIAMGIAIQKFAERIQEGKALVQGALDAQRLYAEAVASGTQESIQAQLEELRVKQQARQIERDLLQQQIDDLNLIQRILSGGQFKKQLRDTEGDLTETTSAISRLQQALTDQRVVARSAAQEEIDESEQLAQAFLDGKISLAQYRQGQEDLLNITQQAEAKAKALEKAREDTKKATEEATKAEEERIAAIEQTISLSQRAAQNIQTQRQLQQETDQLVAEARQQEAEALGTIVDRAREAADKAVRQLDYSIQRIRDRLSFDVTELGFDRQFAQIAARRRQAAFDIASTRRDARFDQMERNIDLQNALTAERVRQEKAINDLIAQRAQIMDEAFRNIINQMLSAAGLWTPGGGPIDLRNRSTGLTRTQQRQVSTMIGAGLEAITR